MLERHQSAAGVDRHADRVEAQLGRARTIVVLLEPSRRHPAQPPALRLAQPVERSGRTQAPGLDLAEDDPPLVGGDQVELAPARTVVAREDREPAALQVLGGELLADATEAVTEVV